jgi:hypothetical protein
MSNLGVAYNIPSFFFFLQRNYLMMSVEIRSTIEVRNPPVAVDPFAGKRGSKGVAGKERIIKIQMGG